MGQVVLPPEGTALYHALNSALGDERMYRARQIYGMTGADSKRPMAWKAYGWKETLGFNDYYRLWERGSLAFGAIGRINTKCWEDEPEVIEGTEKQGERPPTQWEAAFKALAKSVKLWENLKEADLRRTVGKYSAIILQIADGKPWDQPVRGRAARRLVKVIPAWQGQLKPLNYGTDETDSETYGLPTMYQFREGDVSLGGDAPVANLANRNLTIHPDRVIILGDIAHGVPLLRAPYNDFVNLEKISGGSGESFLKNAARQLNINFDKSVNLIDIATAHGVKKEKLKELYDGVTEGLNQGIDQTVITQAANVTPLVSTVPDPQQHFNVSLMSAAAALMIPVMVWIGSQTGERASSEDQKDWNKTMQGRRTQVLSSDIETVVAHLARIGLIKPVAESAVIWSDLSEATLAEKLDNALKMGQTNAQFMATGEVPFTPQEARAVAGYDNNGALTIALPEGEDDDDEDVPAQK